MSEHSATQNELLLRHILDKLDKVSERLEELSGHKNKINELDKKVYDIDGRVSALTKAMTVIEYETKRKEEMKKNFMNPAIQKIIMICIGIVCLSVGAVWKDINYRSEIDIHKFTDH